ncbi:unnamed protein product [Sphagnum jensenii]|uniref:Uncharacterized protein n=1 Tax=Sphagnum jensenii TaxID=128206 RepID=A0ABP1AW08_9BRYO
MMRVSKAEPSNVSQAMAIKRRPLRRHFSSLLECFLAAAALATTRLFPAAQSMKVGCSGCVITESRQASWPARTLGTTALRVTDGWACLQAQLELHDMLEVARWQGEAEIGNSRAVRYPDAQPACRDRRRPLLRTLLSANRRSYSVSFIRCMILDLMSAPGASGLN